MNKKLKILLPEGRVVEVPYKTPAIEAVKLVEKNIDNILSLKINNEVKNYKYELVKDSKIEYVTIESSDGYRVYSRTLKWYFIWLLHHFIQMQMLSLLQLLITISIL